MEVVLFFSIFGFGSSRFTKAKYFPQCAPTVEGIACISAAVGHKEQCVKAKNVVGKRNLALMRNDEMHEMEVDCSM